MACPRHGAQARQVDGRTARLADTEAPGLQPRLRRPDLVELMSLVSADALEKLSRDGTARAIVERTGLMVRESLHLVVCRRYPAQEQSACLSEESAELAARIGIEPSFGDHPHDPPREGLPNESVVTRSLQGQCHDLPTQHAPNITDLSCRYSSSLRTSTPQWDIVAPSALALAKSLMDKGAPGMLHVAGAEQPDTF